MFSAAIFFSAVIILLQTSTATSQAITKFIKGSLVDSWNFNFTFFTTDLEGAVLLLVDYERNQLLVLVTKENNVKSISLRFNSEVKESALKDLCGCSVCEEKMMNVYIKSLDGVIEMNCNKFGHVNLRKEDIIDRVNKRIPNDIRTKMDNKGTNHIYTSTSLDKIGCVESLYHNRERIYFEEQGSKFLSSCARSCPIGDCHEGKCRALVPSGPMCDCSSTPLSGLYCNNTMIPYNKEASNSYYRMETSNDLYLKFTWKQKHLNKKYCLLEFVNEYGPFTLTVHQGFILKGAEVLASIDSSGINYIDINVANKGVTIKVNNKQTDSRPALLGKLKLNVGFSEKIDQCETFEGTYDFFHNFSQLQPVQISTTTTEIRATQKRLSPNSEFRVDIKIIILATGSSLLVTVLFLAVLLGVIFIRRYHNRKEILAENVYDAGFRKHSSRNNTELLGEDHYEALEYDRLNPNRFSTTNKNAMDNALPELPPRNSEL